jgi:lysophospholipase L1-like esterase
MDEWVEGVRSGYPRLRAAGQTLRQSGVAFADLSMIFRDVSAPLYYDACHFNEAGNAILAREIAGAVQRDVLLPQRDSRR